MIKPVISNKQRICGIDLDGVCFDFMNAFRLWLNDKTEVHLEKNEITSYYWYEDTDLTKEDFMREFDRFGDEGHGYRNLNLLPGAFEGLNKLHKAGYKIYYITNRPLYAYQDTVDCLEEHKFPQRENLYFAKGAKAPLIREFNIDVFIDDSPRTIAELTANTRATVYCRNYKFNEHLDDTFFTRVNGWDEFLDAEGINV